MYADGNAECSDFGFRGDRSIAVGHRFGHAAPHETRVQTPNIANIVSPGRLGVAILQSLSTARLIRSLGVSEGSSTELGVPATCYVVREHRAKDSGVFGLVGVSKRMGLPDKRASNTRS